MSEETPKKQSGKLKTLIILGGILLLEAGTIIGAMMFFGGPAEAEAGEAVAAAGVPEEEKIAEVLILDARLPNARRGVTYLYETKVFAQVKRKYADRVSNELEQFQNEIHAEIVAIWRTSEPHDFQEPRLETLNRKVHALLSDRFGMDGETNEAVVSKSVIVMGTGFRVDG